MSCGLLLVIIGAVFLLRNLGYVSGSAWGIIWPSLLLALGLVSLFGPPRRRFWVWWERVGWRGRRTRQDSY